jgi:hypothetical protein
MLSCQLAAPSSPDASCPVSCLDIHDVLDLYAFSSTPPFEILAKRSDGYRPALYLFIEHSVQ